MTDTPAARIVRQMLRASVEATKPVLRSRVETYTRSLSAAKRAEIERNFGDLEAFERIVGRP